jgi:hypothetical protein
MRGITAHGVSFAIALANERYKFVRISDTDKSTGASCKDVAKLQPTSDPAITFVSKSQPDG